jgi:RNA polymerase sigma factor (sigma-70 family)
MATPSEILSAHPPQRRCKAVVQSSAVKSDGELLRAFTERGDEEAFREIVQRHANMVYGAAVRQAGSAMADDITQGVFILLSRKARKVDGMKLAAWLLSVTRLMASDARRREGRLKRRELVAATEAADRVQADHPHAADEAAEMVPLLDGAMARLREMDRAAVALRYLEERSLQEVATLMGTTPDAATKRVSRAVAKLRDDFERHGVMLSAGAVGEAMSRSVRTLTVPSHVASHAAAAASSTGNAAAAELARRAIQSETRRTWSRAAALAIVIFGCLLGYALIGQARATAPGVATSPTTATVTTPIKVGVIVTAHTSEPRYGAHGNEAIAKQLKDPSIELYAIIDPGSEDENDVVEAINQYFPKGRKIIGDDPKQLAKLDVIVASRAWYMQPEVLDAIEEAVNGGVGFLYQSQVGFQNPGFRDTLHGMDGEGGFFQGPQGKALAVIVSNHPLLGTLRDKVGSKISIGHSMGPTGSFEGTPLLAMPRQQGRQQPISSMNSGELPASAQEMAKHPTTRVSGDVFYPLLISQHGKGKIIGCNWHDPVAPPELDKAHDGRFYIHCVQWLAGRKLE